MLGPVVVRLPLVDWTYDPETDTAVAGYTIWPLGVALDAGPIGEAVRGHEMCHWRHRHSAFLTRAASEAAERMCDYESEWH